MSNLGRIDAEGIYLRVPTPLQHLACSVVGWQTERTRYAGDFRSLLEDAQSAQEEMRRMNVGPDLADEWNAIVQILTRMRDLAGV